MNTTPLKSFAVQSRSVLKQGVLNRILELGFDLDGNVNEDDPVKVQGGAVFMGQLKADEGFYDAWMELKSRIAAHGIKEVCEEAAYTWFNRLVAIRIMQKNHFIEPVMEYVDAESRVPVIVAQARAGRLTLRLNADDAERLNKLLADPIRIEDQFKLLIEAFCELNPVIYNCFGGIDKYISLLLPDNILVKGGFVDLLNSTSYLTEEDFAQSELIGWLYQFYISEKKDEVFASKTKVSQDDIPAATQIFTPNWIVKYMVQNTIGRIYLDNNPDSSLGDGMRYLVKSDVRTPEEAVLKVDDITEYKLIDPACGSGHILNEGFDLLYDMYMDEFYSPRAAVENIFRRNLIGIDIDTRARQLSTFSLLMKAARKDRSFLDAKVMPRVLDMPEPFECPGDLKDFLKQFFAGGSSDVIAQTQKAFELLRQAKNLGSIMRFDISEPTWYQIETRTEEWKSKAFIPEEIKKALPSMRLILALTDKYTSVVANPPYMGSGNMNPELSKYVNENYRDGKADLFSVFMLLSESLLVENGKYGMINMQSWMFLSSFEKLREHIIKDLHIDNMLHLGPRTFDELSGEVVQNTAFVVSNIKSSYNGVYINLCDGDCRHKEAVFLSNMVPAYVLDQNSFLNIPGYTFAYWISHRFFDIISSNISIGDISEPRAGLQTSDNPRFLRLWSEVDFQKIGINLPRKVALESPYKWFPHNKGGESRKWYGNRNVIINFEKDGTELKYWLEHNPKDPTTKSWSRNLRNYPLYFNEGITWGGMGNTINVRYSPRGCTFDTSGPMLFSTNALYYILGLTNSTVFDSFISIFAQGLSKGSGHFAKVPYIQRNLSYIESVVKNNIVISQSDWDAHETSWDFQENEIVRIFRDKGCHSVEEAVGEYKKFWTEQFDRLHANEEELNRQFIDIYGLQDELSPDVPLDEVTILQQGEISIEEG